MHTGGAEPPKTLLILTRYLSLSAEPLVGSYFPKHISYFIITVFQGGRYDPECGGALSQRSEIRSEFCLSVLANKKWPFMVPSSALLLQQYIKGSEVYYFLQRGGGAVPPWLPRFRLPYIFKIHFSQIFSLFLECYFCIILWNLSVAVGSQWAVRLKIPIFSLGTDNLPLSFNKWVFAGHAQKIPVVSTN